MGTPTLEDVQRLPEERRQQLLQAATPRIVDPYIPHTPHPPQTLFLTLDEYQEVFYGGAAGGGKSDALLMSGLQYADVPGYAALILRKTYADLTLPGAIMDRAWEWLRDTPARPIQGGRSWLFPSGARLTFGYVQHHKDVEQYRCFHPETELLTEYGWRPVAAVERGDRVATVNPQTREMTYRPATEAWRYEHDGDLLTVDQAQGVSFAVTPNHTLWYSTDKMTELRPSRADELPGAAHIPQSVDWEGEDPGPQVFTTTWGRNRTRSITFSADDWAEFLGWWVAEGTADGGPRWAVRLSQTKPDGRAKISALLNRVPNLRWACRPQELSFNSKAVVEHLHAHCRDGDGAAQKRLPSYVRSWDQRRSAILLGALVDGDGTRYPTGRMRFVTVSPGLADDVCELALRAGYRPTVSRRKADYGNWRAGNTEWVYHVSLSARPGDTTVRPGSISRVPYAGPVHCVSVPPHGTLVTRRNGRVSVSGNSAEFQFIAFDELTQFEERTYQFLFSRLRRPAFPCEHCGVNLKRDRGRWRHAKQQGETRKPCNRPKVSDDVKPSQVDGTTLGEVPLRMRSASNPGGLGHSWVRDRFVDEEQKVEGAIFIPALLTDNPSLDQESYAKSLEHLSHSERERLLRGDWSATDEGSMFHRHWFEVVDEAPADIRWVRYWDLASGESKPGQDPDYTAGALLGFYDGKWYLANMRRGQLTPGQAEQLVKQTAMEDGRNVAIWMEQEPGSSGVNTIDHYRRNVLYGFEFRGHHPTGSKVERARPMSSAAEAGNFLLVNGPWIRRFLDEAEAFPFGAHDDQIDACTGAMTVATQRQRARLIV